MKRGSPDQGQCRPWTNVKANDSVCHDVVARQASHAWLMFSFVGWLDVSVRLRRQHVGNWCEVRSYNNKNNNDNKVFVVPVVVSSVALLLPPFPPPPSPFPLLSFSSPHFRTCFLSSFALVTCSLVFTV